MGVKVIRNIMTGLHRENTRIFIEPVTLEAAGFKVGDLISQVITKDAVILRLSDEKTGHTISKRKRPSWTRERPLYETYSKNITLVIQPRERIDMLVSDGMIVIRKERSFDLFVIEQPQLQGAGLQKLRLYSGPSGGGFATAAAVDTGLYEAVGGVDISAAAIAAYMHNFKAGCVFLGDLTRKHSDYIPQSDVCWLSPSCVEYSSLGTLTDGITEGHGPHFARIAMATGASAIIIEQVPAYFKSTSYRHLKSIIKPFFPIVHETTIDAYNVGSVASRTRGYAVLFRERTDFHWPQMPRLTEHRRKSVGQVIGKDWINGDWRPIEGTVMHGLLNKTGNNNFKSEKNHTLVGLDSKRISAIVASYRKYQVTSSYLKHPEKEEWRPFRSDELAALLNVPAFYEFPDWMTEGDKTKLIGQSVDCDVVRSIQIEVAAALMGMRYKQISKSLRVAPLPIDSLLQDESGQFAFHF
ncbi:DNA cytosine methyltransferase [Bacillus sp. FJAT-28004]|uniref:DNA cytosine methyltransferase n=1 Tax=Bacillus sp. FJAT-28004 TaxID=1679165 RepID=UPI0006B4CD33|nr:DNA cytosine methyltransferase [Bacillus sp. FJAT-28004]